MPSNNSSPWCATGHVLPCMRRAARTTLPPNACPIAWWPRQTPRVGTLPASALTRGTRMPDWAAGDSPRAGSPGGGAAPARRGALPPRADAVLARRGAHRAAPGVRPGRLLLGAPHPERRAPAESRLPLGALPVAGGGGTRISRLSVGRAAARGGAPRGAVRTGTPTAARCRAPGIGAGALSPRVAAVPPNVPVGHREADERRPHVAQSHGARLPLLDSTAPHLERLVCESAPGWRQEADGRGHLSARDRRPVPDLRAPPCAARRLHRDNPDAAPDLRDRELQLLQSAHRGTRAPAGGRRRVGARVSRQAVAGPAGTGARSRRALPPARDDAARRLAPRRELREGVAHLLPVRIAPTSHRAAHGLGRAVPQREQLRPVPRDDDGASGDRGGG